MGRIKDHEAQRGGVRRFAFKRACRCRTPAGEHDGGRHPDVPTKVRVSPRGGFDTQKRRDVPSHWLIPPTMPQLNTGLPSMRHKVQPSIDSLSLTFIPLTVDHMESLGYFAHRLLFNQCFGRQLHLPPPPKPPWTSNTFSGVSKAKCPLPHSYESLCTA